MDFWLRDSVLEFYIPLKLANYLSLIYFPYKKFPARQSIAAVTRVPLTNQPAMQSFRFITSFYCGFKQSVKCFPNYMLGPVMSSP